MKLIYIYIYWMLKTGMSLGLYEVGNIVDSFLIKRRKGSAQKFFNQAITINMNLKQYKVG